jgi:acyl-CoA reductase-like NAD-dependent aldehyde dehydrogenase
LEEPVGTVVHIFPSNYPIVLLAWQCAAALAAGNACIVKPSELTPLTTLQLGPLFDHLPAGIFNIVTATGAGSAQLVGHEGTDMIAFTGSVATGRRVMEGAAPRIKKLLLELGGNNPYIVLADSKLDPASRGAVFSAFLNAGQVCTAASRFYVEESVFDEFMEHAVSQTEALRIGDPMEDVDVGPMVARPLTENIDRALEEFADKGAHVRTGGGRPANSNRKKRSSAHWRPSRQSGTWTKP